MKSVDFENGEVNIRRACAFCRTVKTTSGLDVRDFYCIAPGGRNDTDANRYLIDEPCSTRDSQRCIVWLRLEKEGKVRRVP